MTRHEPEQHRTNTAPAIAAMIVVGLLTVGFLAFVSYYGWLWTYGKPFAMMR